MNQKQLEQVVRDLMSGALLANWHFYVVLLFIVIVGGAAVAFVAPYLRSRGNAYATKADFDELLAQLKQTTEATEKIKITVSHDDWKAKEYKTLRRLKLEELLLAIYESEGWLDKRKEWWWSEDDVKWQSPFHKVTIVSALYFPELNSVANFSVKFASLNHFIVNRKGALQQVKGDDAKTKEAWDETFTAYKKIWGEFQEATSAVEKEAGLLMKAILA